MRVIQNAILSRLKKGKAYRIDYWLADNITRANYADFLNPDKPVSFRAHFMFHTDMAFNGFSDGEKRKEKHGYLGHCCWCEDERACFEERCADTAIEVQCQSQCS